MLRREGGQERNWPNRFRFLWTADRIEGVTNEFSWIQSFPWIHQHVFDGANMTESLRGQFLIAAKRLRDDNFYKTVVLLLEHGDHGAMGLVINRPSSLKVSDALARHFDLPETDAVVFGGGPVEPSALVILHDDSAFQDNGPSVLPGLFVGGSPDAFERVIGEASTNDSLQHSFRVFSGYSGWGSGQLEGEIARGDWLSFPASRELVFYEDPYEIYDVLLKRLYEANHILPHRVKDPSAN
jgi:putative transcriptional regulator